MELGDRPDTEPAAGAMHHATRPDSATLADMIARVEEALAIADALDLGFVGIDLCAALERLKDIADGADPATY
jgi:hypothetical protein